MKERQRMRFKKSDCLLWTRDCAFLHIADNKGVRFASLDYLDEGWPEEDT